ncbi:diguanylate cyclase domain-containing protein [Brevundimonas vesicularis]|uniref:diguanylate cyclase domain-containing protein n=1 Tax=Brevundimonas vesicularis TaxID=41276 RepID=UPI0038D3BD8F
MLIEPRVLVVAARDDMAGPLCQGLDGLGWSTVTARTRGAAAQALSDLRLDAVILDARDPGLEGLAFDLRKVASPRHLSILAIGDLDQQAANEVDLVMSRPLHPVQTALRLNQLTRASIAEEEFSLRLETFASHGVTLDVPELSHPPLQILTAGPADRRFLALSNALTAGGAEVVAAPTPFTAFDYLHERSFDGVVLWSGDDIAPALSIAAGMKRNTRLYHIPLTLCLNRPEEALQDIFNRGVADVAAVGTPEEDTAERVIALARNHRRRKAIRMALDSVRGSVLVDAATGLFTPELFAAHLARVTEGARQRSRPVCVCVLRVPQSEALVQARPSGWLQAALPQVGAMISRLVRVEDTAARLGPELFALILPAVTEAEARLAAERIAAVIGCTAFEAGEGRSPFVIELEIGVGQARAGETPAVMLERASADLGS